MRIAFFGLPLAAVLLSADGHDIVWAGLCRPGAIGTRRLVRRIGRDRVHVVPDPDGHLETLERLRPDLVVSWFWTRKLSAAVRATAHHGAIGCHPSLLPRHRGPDPYFWAIASGDRETGVTVHRLDDTYDTGAMLAWRTLTIDDDDDAWSLARRLDRPSLALLREVVGRFAEGDIPADVAQDDARATEAPAPSDDDLALDPRAGIAPLLRRIRAAAPWPGASMSVGETTLLVHKAARIGDAPRALGCGEVTVDAGGRVILGTSDGAAQILSATLDGGDGVPLTDAELATLVRRAAQADPPDVG